MYTVVIEYMSNGGTLVTGKTHIAFGVLIGTQYAIAQSQNISQFAAIIGTTALFSIIPDICHAGSKLGRKIWPISILIRLLFGHRTVTHSIFFVILTSVLLYVLQVEKIYIFSAIFGVLSHLFLDMLTPSGVTLFFPWQKKIRFPFKFKTGGIIDLSLATTFSIVTMYIVYNEIVHRTIFWIK